jgi:23S rRNA pseudouridine955/2504/2580 synthase
MKELTVSVSDAGQRLDRWLKKQLPGTSFVAVQKGLRKGSIRVDGKRAKPDSRLASGQIVAIRPEILGSAPTKTQQKKPDYSKQDATRKLIMYSDKRCLILNKPTGLAVQGGSGIKDSIDARLPLLAERGETLKLVHRLDKDTSGALLIARNREAAALFSKSFARKTTQKLYWALLVGVPEMKEGEIQGALEKQGSQEKMQLSEDGKAAVTRYRVLEALGDRLCWVEMEPVTGRTHQLRAHAAAMGHPILGDGKYGGKHAFLDGMELPKKLHLHAHRLIVPEQNIDISAPLPAHMKTSFNRLALTVY